MANDPVVPYWTNVDGQTVAHDKNGQCRNYNPTTGKFGGFAKAQPLNPVDPSQVAPAPQPVAPVVVASVAAPQGGMGTATRTAPQSQPQPAPQPAPAAAAAAPQPQPAAARPHVSSASPAVARKSTWQKFKDALAAAAAILLLVVGVYMYFTWNTPPSGGLTKADLTTGIKISADDLKKKFDESFAAVEKVQKAAMARLESVEKNLSSLESRVQKIEEPKPSTTRAPAVHPVVIPAPAAPREEPESAPAGERTFSFPGGEAAWAKLLPSAKYDSIADACSVVDHAAWKYIDGHTAEIRYAEIKRRKLTLADAREFVRTSCDPAFLEGPKTPSTTRVVEAPSEEPGEVEPSSVREACRAPSMWVEHVGCFGARISPR